MARGPKTVMRSGLETQMKDMLDGGKVEYEYESETLPYTIPASERTYLPDFKFPNGIYIEVKGKLDIDARRKMILVKAQNPDADIRFLFHRNNLLRKRGKMRYADWCKKEGFPFTFIAPGKTVEQELNWKEQMMEWYDEQGIPDR